MSGQRFAQFIGDSPFGRINDQSIVAGSTDLDALGAQLRKQVLGGHSSITSRSVSNEWRAGAGKVSEAVLAAGIASGALVAQASMACLIKVRGTLRSLSVCSKVLRGPIAVGSRRSIRASTEARLTSGAGSFSAPIKCGVASRS